MAFSQRRIPARLASLATAIALLFAAACRQAEPPAAPAPPPFQVLEADLGSMQAAMSAGTLTARRLSEMYLERIRQNLQFLFSNLGSR